MNDSQKLIKSKDSSKLSRIMRFGLILMSLVIFIIYGFSTVLIEYLIRSNLPNNITLTAFESDYPNFTHLNISKIEIAMNGKNFTITDLNIGYDMNEVNIGALSIAEISSEDNKTGLVERLSNNPFELPNINLKELSALNDLPRIDIERTEIVGKNKKITLSNILFNKLDDNLFQVQTDWLDVNKSHKLELFLSTDNYSKVNVKVESDGAKLALFEYSSVDSKTALQVSLEAKDLVGKINQLGFELPFAQINKINLSWEFSRLNKKSKLELNVDAVPNKNFLEVVNSKIVSSSEESVVFKIAIDSTNQDSVDIIGTADFLDSFTIKNEQLDLNITNFRITVGSKLDFSNINNPDGKISLPESTINVSLNKASFNKNGQTAKQLSGVANHINIQSNFSNMEFPIIFKDSDYSFSKILKDVTNSIKTKIDVEELFLKYRKHESENQPNEINMQTAIAGEFFLSSAANKQILSNGTLDLSDMTLMGDGYDAQGNINVNWKELDSLLNSGELEVGFSSDYTMLSDVILEQFSLDAKVRLSKGKMIADGNITINNQLLSPYNIVYSKDTSKLSLQLKKDKLDSKIFSPFLSSFGKKNNIELNILEGNTQQSTKILLTDVLAINSYLKIEKALIMFGENTISGLDIKQEITSIEPVKLNAEISIDEINFNSGLQLSKVRAIIKSESSDMTQINDLTAEIFEGQIGSKIIVIKEGLLLPSILNLTGISLTELVFFMDVAGLFVEGKMDMKLPLSMEKNALGEPESIVIKNGTFHTTKAGILNYSTGEVSDSDNENIALKALRNFHYQSLDGEISYDKNGAYTIKLHLLGSNPDLYDGYPIDFALNLKGELSGLFRSLFLTGDFEKAVLEQVKTGEIKES